MGEFIGNSTVNSSLTTTQLKVGSNSTFTMLTANATGLYANTTLVANSIGPYGKTEGNLNVNSATYATSAGSATNASAATNATYATSAGSATNASAATNATTVTTNTSSNTFTIGTAAYYVANGNVGIGTASPGYKLDVSGSSRISSGGGASLIASNTVIGPLGIGYALYGEYSAAGGAGLEIGSNQSNTSGAWISLGGGARGDGSKATIMFSTGESGSFGERMRVASNGNVGIGNTAPANKLAVTGSAYFGTNTTLGYEFSSWSASATYYGLTAPDHATSEYFMLTGGQSDKNMYLSTYNGASVKIRGGNNASTYEISVSGTARPTVGGNIILDAGNYNSYSPTLTGGSASGTWSININGSAASATNASAATNATYATSAGSATNASSATNAGYATNAGNADTVDSIHGTSFLRNDVSSWQNGGSKRLFRNDGTDNYSVQTYWTGSRWRLYGYLNDSGHADTHVGYADSAGSATNASAATNATYATSAGSATNATYATSAGSATNATYATSSGSGTLRSHVRFTNTTITVSSNISSITTGTLSNGRRTNFSSAFSTANSYSCNISSGAESNHWTGAFATTYIEGAFGNTGGYTNCTVTTHN